VPNDGNAGALGAEGAVGRETPPGRRWAHIESSSSSLSPDPPLP
jgi:hypothetical protein